MNWADSGTEPHRIMNWIFKRSDGSLDMRLHPHQIIQKKLAWETELKLFSNAHSQS